MNGYSEDMTLAYDFNNLSEGAASAQPSTTFPSAAAQHESSNQTRQPQSQSNVAVYQTTGADAHTDPITALGSDTPALNPRSCVTCRRRKVRCDKQMPCSNCRRAQIPCVFPAPGRARRQPRSKDPNAPPKNSSQREMELMKRLRKLEGIVEDLSGQIEVESGGKGPSSASSPEAVHGTQSVPLDQSTSFATRHPSNVSTTIAPFGGSPRGSDAASVQSEPVHKHDLNRKFGRLVLNDQNGARRYVSNGFWAKLNDELDSIREETQKLTGEDLDDSDFEDTPDHSPQNPATADHHSFIFGYRSADVDLDKCRPLPSHVPFLWYIYQENVEPLIKAVHVPSTEKIFRDTRKNHDQLSPGDEALVWAIYYAAITSLDPDEVMSNLGEKKDEVLIKYRFAVEQALSKANFLNTSDMTVLQAFVIFLVVVRRQDESRFCWSLTGLVIHLAQGMGLHRDGSHFGLSPFETEMRRRIWWALLVLDLRAADELGGDLIIGDTYHDTKMPTNINDTDISPESTEFPEEREGRSDTAVALVRYEICLLCRGLIKAASASINECPKDAPIASAGLEERERMLAEIYQRVESKFLKHVMDETDPLYWMAAMVARIIMAKMCLVIYQPLLFPGSDGELPDEARKRLYMASIEIVEYNHILNVDSRYKQYKWLFQTYTNWHAMAYFLIDSCRRRWTPLVERGWQALNGYEGHPADYVRTGDWTSVILPIKKLFLRAGKHRALEIARLRANPVEAHRLAFQERMEYAHSRFGTVPGGEDDKMDMFRDAWTAMIRTDNSAVPLAGVPIKDYMEAAQARPTPSVAQPVSRSRPRTPPTSEVPANLDLSDAAMSLMSELMSHSSTISMTALWPLNDVGSSEINDHTAAKNQDMTPGVSSADFGRQQMVQGLGMDERTAQFPRDDNVPPYLWIDPFPAAHTDFNDVGGDDVDMLGEDFNWQDWSQNIRDLEMESVQQGQKKW